MRAGFLRRTPWREIDGEKTHETRGGGDDGTARGA